MNNIIDENTYKEIQQLSAVYKTGYLELLRLNSIVYDDDIKEKLETGEYDNYVLDDDFLELLDIMAEVNITEKFFDPKVKSNILEILNYIKAKKTNDESVQRVVRMLNASSKENCYTFYRNQYLLRSGMLSEETKKEYDPSIFEDEVALKELRFSLACDYQIVIALIDGTIEEKEDILLSEFFINTINDVKYECPQLLAIPSINKCVKEILNRIRKEKLSNIDTLGRHRAKVLLKKINKLA